MIVAPLFEGDDDDEVALKQHDVYGHALAVIVSTCNRHVRFARAVLNDADHPGWGTVEDFDHRTMQNAHDLLAAAWRFRHDFRQSSLPFESENPREKVQTLWLDWLRREIADWTTKPGLVRSVQLVLTNQNKPAGYVAEGQLCLDILDWFSEVPWKPSLREAHEADITRFRKVIGSATGEVGA